MKPANRDRIHRRAGDHKKSARSMEESATDEWEPQPAKLREGETTDEMSHAEKNLEQLRRGLREMLPDVGERVETPHQNYVVSTEQTVDGAPAVLLTTPESDQELYRLRYANGEPLLEYHRQDKTRRPVGDRPRRSWHPRSREVTWGDE